MTLTWYQLNDRFNQDSQDRDGHRQNQYFAAELNFRGNCTLSCILRNLGRKFRYISDPDDFEDRFYIDKIHFGIYRNLFKHMDDGINLVNEKQENAASGKDNEQKSKVGLLLFYDECKEGCNQRDACYLKDLNR